MLEPIVAELGARAKIDILQAWAKHIKPVRWSTGIKSWVNRVQKVNEHRNIVAHHQVVLSDGKLTLFSPQARKLLKKLKDLKPAPAKNIKDINNWVEEAKDAYEQGEKLLANLDRFAEEFAKRQAQ
jgi:hypothetical protein